MGLKKLPVTISSLLANNMIIVLLPAPVMSKKALVAAMLASNRGLARITKENVESSYFVASPLIQE